MKLSCIVTEPQVHLRPRLIVNLLEKLDAGTPCVNNTTNRDVAPELLQFRRSFSRILQEVCEAYPAQVLVQVSKLDVTDA